MNLSQVVVENSLLSSIIKENDHTASVLLAEEGFRILEAKKKHHQKTFGMKSFRLSIAQYICR